MEKKHVLVLIELMVLLFHVALRKFHDTGWLSAAGGGDVDTYTQCM